MYKLFVVIASVIAVSAHAGTETQKLSCKEVGKSGKELKDGRTLKAEIEGNLSKLEKVDFNSMSDNEVRKYELPIKSASMSVKGFWKPNSKFGKGKSYTSGMLGKDYWDQHGNKATLTIGFEDEEGEALTYTLYLNTEDLGQSFKAKRARLWIDPDLPEGGGWPLDFTCSSKAE